jgi:hypothetical protein
VQAGEVDGALGSHALRRISRVRDEVPE